MAKIAVQARLAQLVAIDAGGHGNILFLPEGVAFLHGAMAYRAFHAGADVFLMVEESQVRKLVHGSPGKKAVVFLELSQFLDRRAVGLDALMAGHTFLEPGDRHLAAYYRGLMAGFTFHSCLNMLPMTEWDRLGNRFDGSGDVVRLASRARRNRPSLTLEIYSRGSFSFREQGIGRQNSGGGGVGIEISARPHCNHHKLFLRFLSQIGDGRGVSVGFEFVDPEFFSRPRFEGSEAVIRRAADKDQSSSGGD